VVDERDGEGCLHGIHRFRLSLFDFFGVFVHFLK
jgi:hypothetical protein